MDILNILIQAKECYISRVNLDMYLKGMCSAIQCALNKKYPARFDMDIYFNDNTRLIPEFNKAFLGGTTESGQDYWWPLEDTESRLKAFDILINIYSNKE